MHEATLLVALAFHHALRVASPWSANFPMLPSRTNMTAFSRTVNHVVSLRPKEKMLRIDTSRVVAAMANLHPLRNLATPNHPSSKVRKIKSSVETEASIPLLVR